MAFVDRVFDFFDSGVGSIEGPYGGTAASAPIPIVTDVVLFGNEEAFVSLPTDSFITVGFAQQTIFDGPGNDIIINEAGSRSEFANVFVSSDLENFSFLGTAGPTSSAFDLSTIGFTQPVRAIQIVGLDNIDSFLNDSGGGRSRGFDLLNVEVPDSSLRDIITPTNGNSSAQDVVRFWDFSTLSHIFTSNQAEIDDLTGQPTSFRNEGNEFDVPVNDGDPVFRYLNTATGSIFLSFESGIEESLPQFINTGVAFNGYRPVGTTETRPANAPANAIPVYRLTNLDAEQANPLNITHFYTSDPNNRQLVLDTLNYRDEFVGFWALPAGTNGLV